MAAHQKPEHQAVADLQGFLGLKDKRTPPIDWTPECNQCIRLWRLTVSPKSIAGHNCPMERAVTLTRAPMTPKLVSLRYSNGLVLLVVFKKGYRNRGTCAAARA